MKTRNRTARYGNKEEIEVKIEETVVLAGTYQLRHKKDWQAKKVEFTDGVIRFYRGKKDYKLVGLSLKVYSGSNGWATIMRNVVVKKVGIKDGETKVVEVEKVIKQEVSNEKIVEMLTAIVDIEVLGALVEKSVLEHANRPKVIEIKKTKKTIKCDGEHKQFPLVMQMVAARQHTFLVGPAGSGKTTVCHHAAEKLGLPFYAISVGPQTSQYQIMGHVDASGKYHDSLFRKAYEKGGVFLFDEIDAANPAVLTVINAALSNGSTAFPDKMVKKHKDFICVAAGNTYGLGANRVYVGRNQLDGATLDRFAFIEFTYDEEFERKLANNDEWVDFVQAARQGAEAEAIRHVISPRASIQGAILLAAGVDRPQVEKMMLWKGLPEESKTRIKARMVRT